MFGARIQDLRLVIYLASSALSLFSAICFAAMGYWGKTPGISNRLLDQLISVNQIILAA